MLRCGVHAGQARADFRGRDLSYAAFYARIERRARAAGRVRRRRGDRVAILSLNRPDYLVLLYACARLGAMLVPLNWRLAVAEQLFICRDAGAKVLVLEQAFARNPARAANRACPSTGIVGLDFAPPRASRSMRCWRRPRGDGRDPRRRPLLPAADRLHLRHHRPAQGRGAAAGGAAVERGDEPAHARPDLGRSRADRAAVLPCRRPQHPDHAGAASARP